MNGCLKNAQNSLCIQSVNLKESKIFVRDEVDLPALNRDKTAIQSFRVIAKVKEISLTVPGGGDVWDYRFFYSVGVRLIYLEEKEESTKSDYNSILEIAGLFEAKYLSKKQLTKEEQKAFSADNVGYHVWPYWREYVQASCARIGFFPSIAVPVYIAPGKEENNKPVKET